MNKKTDEKIIDLQDVLELMRFYPTLSEAACWFNCSEDTVERLVREGSGLTFKEFRLKYSGKTRLLLKRTAITQALEEGNDKMLLYCLRTMTDLDDRLKPENRESGVCEIKLSYQDSLL